MTRCRADQASLIDKLVRAECITDDERSPILHHLTHGTLSEERANECIRWLSSTMRARLGKWGEPFAIAGDSAPQHAAELTRALTGADA